MPAEPAFADVGAVSAAPPDTYAFGVKSSYSGHAWRFRSAGEEAVQALQMAGLSGPLAAFLAARGVPAEGVHDYLAPRLKTLLPDPSCLREMDIAAERFTRAIEAGEHIAILGDYDVDGACASALLLRFLARLGHEALLHIPDRMTEGYGPTPGAMRRLADAGAKLIVTVDCGAAAADALECAKALGCDVVVLDHHAVESRPPAFAHVNANGPGDRSGLTQLCAAGVVFLMLAAVQRQLRKKSWFAGNGAEEQELLADLDLVALATVADVVPLTGVNRAFVRQGLRVLERLQRPGLAALAEVAAAVPPFSAYHLGFVFGPRINAGGRVGRCDLGARLLAITDLEQARSLAAELDHYNRERRAIEAVILDSAYAEAETQKDAPFVFLAGEGWHPGVVGIVASRLKDRYAKPVLVAGFWGSVPGAAARGSGRSVAGVDLGAIVRAARAEGILESGGGHAMAAGFTVSRERTADLREYLRAAFDPQRAMIGTASDILADAPISPGGATLMLMDELERAGPFGAGNPEPLFIMPDVTVAFADVVGSGHVRLRLAGPGGTGLDAIAFRAADAPLGQGLLKARGRRVHVAGKLRRDDYNGRLRVQMHIEDSASAGV